MQPRLSKGEPVYPLSYNTNGLRNLSLLEAIQAVAAAGYSGIELSMHAVHIHPDTVTTAQVDEIAQTLRRHQLSPVCLATGADDLLSPERFEPSLVTRDESGRARRVAVIRQALDIARVLQIPVVNFASGCLGIGEEREAAWERLVSGIRACLESQPTGPVLAIEPEPGFVVGTTRDAISLIEEIDDPRLVMNMDIGHVYCSEDDFLEAIERAAPYSRHIHIEDIRQRIHCHEVPGDGEIPFDDVFAALERGRYQGCLSVELYTKTGEWQQALERSHAFLLERMKKRTHTGIAR